MKKLLVILSVLSLSTTTSVLVSCSVLQEMPHKLQNIKNLKLDLGEFKYTTAFDLQPLLKKAFFVKNKNVLPEKTKEESFNIPLSSINLKNLTADIYGSPNQKIIYSSLDDKVEILFSKQQEPTKLKDITNLQLNLGTIKTNEISNNQIIRYFLELNEKLLPEKAGLLNFTVISKKTNKNEVLIYGSPNQEIISPNFDNAVTLIYQTQVITNPKIKMNEKNNLTLSLGVVEGTTRKEVQKKIIQKFSEFNAYFLAKDIHAPLYKIDVENKTALITGSIFNEKNLDINISTGVDITFLTTNGNSDFPQNDDGYYYIKSIENGSYYQKAKNVIGENLKKQLTSIVSTNTNPTSYGDVRYILTETDAIRDESGKKLYLRGIYDHSEIPPEWLNSQIDKRAWQREHVWPSARLGIKRPGNSTRGQAGDIHNLRAISGNAGGQSGVNQTRSELYYGGYSDDGLWKKIDSNIFFPSNMDKGDVARICFYMAVRYPDILNIIDDQSKLNSYDAYSPEGANMGLMQMLLRWHKEDPVDDFEVSRNNLIYDGNYYNVKGQKIKPQGNRNPFIDHPEFAHLIWEGKTINDLLLKINYEYTALNKYNHIMIFEKIENVIDNRKENN